MDGWTYHGTTDGRRRSALLWRGRGIYGTGAVRRVCVGGGGKGVVGGNEKEKGRVSECVGMVIRERD